MNTKTAQAQRPSPTGVTFQEVDAANAGQRLDNYLLTRLKGVPKSRIYRIIRKGEVRVNSKREKPDYKLVAGDLVRIPPVRMAAERDMPVPSSSLQALLEQAVLYRDEGLMVLNKPAGLPVHGGTGVRLGLIEALRSLYPDQKGLELVHRLDKGTSGCLLVALTPVVLKSLSARFKSGEISKTYHAIVQGDWPRELREIDAPLLKQEARGGERFVAVSDAGKAALTRFALLESFPEASLVAAMPVTGRTHQIRVHARMAGHPILGDEKYAEAADRKHFAALGIRRLCLHAAELALDHPVTGVPLHFSAPYDTGFETALRILRQAGD